MGRLLRVEVTLGAFPRHISDLVNIVLELIKDEKGFDIEIANQFDPSFHTENKRKSLQKW